MTRNEFIKNCGLLGLGLPFISSCSGVLKQNGSNSIDKVIIIGAGAAGLTAAHLLLQAGIEVEILEASNTYGGRMKRTTKFADFPIPTGAEWLHTERSILNKIVNDSAVKIETITKPYNFDVDHAIIEGRKESLKELGFTIDQKFINATWFDFYEQYIVPGVLDKIRFNQIVDKIDYQDKVVVNTNKGQFKADRVILTVPVKMLQNNVIEFVPALPKEKSEAINNITVWDGCKAFIEFSEKFYPAATGFESIPEHEGHKLFYDAAYGQNTQQNILGVFAVGPVSKPYLERNDKDLIDHLLAELDGLYDGQASPNYKKHIFQNWTAEPFANGAYVHYFEDWKNIRALGKSVKGKLYFAGDAYTDGSEWSSVDAAANSAMRAVEQLMA